MAHNRGKRGLAPGPKSTFLDRGNHSRAGCLSPFPGRNTGVNRSKERHNRRAAFSRPAKNNFGVVPGRPLNAHAFGFVGALMIVQRDSSTYASARAIAVYPVC